MPTWTSTPVPTATLRPTPTIEPAPPLDGAAVEAALREHGYKRQPFHDEAGGGTAYFWDNGSGISFYTYEDGFEFNFLNDKRNLSGRAELIDKSIEIIAPLFSRQFIRELRAYTHSFADDVESPSGEPQVLDYGQEPWLGKLMAFNSQETNLQNGRYRLPVGVGLLFREYKCDMTKYAYCYFYDMPTMTFSGEASLTFFDIWIGFPQGNWTSSTDAPELPDDSLVGLSGQWDHINANRRNPRPEHEILICEQSVDADDGHRVECRYGKAGELGEASRFTPDSTQGEFTGTESTTGWSCPIWFPSGTCQRISVVFSGTMRFEETDGEERLVTQELILTESASGEILYVHWVDAHFICPWYRSFGEALRSNPFPLPFNGVDWPEFDCVLAP